MMTIFCRPIWGLMDGADLLQASASSYNLSLAMRAKNQTNLLWYLFFKDHKDTAKLK
jgi:hypothetical protein